MNQANKPFRHGSQQDRASVAHSVGDLVNVASNDRAQREDGKFLSDHEPRLIEAHADQVRDGLSEREKNKGEAVLEEVVESIDQLETNDKEHEAKDAEQDKEIAELHEIIQLQNLQIDQLTQLIEKLGGDMDQRGYQPKHRGDEPKHRGENQDQSEEYQPKHRLEEEADEKRNIGEELGLFSDERWDDDQRGHDNEETKVQFTPDIPTELKEALEGATGRYAELTAKHRNSHVGHLLKNSKFIVKIPGMKWLAEKANDITDQNLDNARREYQEAVQKIQSTIAGQLELQGASSQEIRRATALFGLEHESVFEAKAVAERTQMSGKTNKFVDWWVRQEGWKGKAKKALVVGAAGVATGFTAGLAVPGIAATVAGGAAGGLIARHVTKRRANAVDAEGQTLAQRQSAEDLAQKEAYHSGLAEDEFSQTSPDGFTNITEDRTAKEKTGNRARMKSAVAVGAGAGRLGDVLGGKPDVPAPEGPNDGPTDAPGPDDTSTPGPESNPTTFNVEYGNGYTNELIDFAQANGHNLSPEQAWDLHQNLVSQFGEDYIDIVQQGVDTYTQGGDFRLTAPGTASWDPGVQQAIQQWMTGRGLW